MGHKIIIHDSIKKICKCPAVKIETEKDNTKTVNS